MNHDLAMRSTMTIGVLAYYHGSGLIRLGSLDLRTDVQGLIDGILL